MTKRFTLTGLFPSGRRVIDNQGIDGMSLPEMVDMMNGLSEENEQLKQQKERYKRLSEIRNEEINNRILTIKEFINNCSNEEVQKALKDLFYYSEVKEYDLSKEYRKLHEENEQLKQRINSRLHFYRELYDSTNDDIVKRVVEDLEDILKMI